MGKLQHSKQNAKKAKRVLSLDIKLYFVQTTMLATIKTEGLPVSLMGGGADTFNEVSKTYRELVPMD